LRRSQIRRSNSDFLCGHFNLFFHLHISISAQDSSISKEPVNKALQFLLAVLGPESEVDKVIRPAVAAKFGFLSVWGIVGVGLVDNPGISVQVRFLVTKVSYHRDLRRRDYPV